MKILIAEDDPVSVKIANLDRSSTRHGFLVGLERV